MTLKRFLRRSVFEPICRTLFCRGTSLDSVPIVCLQMPKMQVLQMWVTLLATTSLEWIALGIWRGNFWKSTSGPTYIGLPSLSGRRKNSKKKKNFCLSFYLTKSCTSSANFLIFPSSEISIHCLQKTWRSFKEEQTFCRLKLSNCFHLVCGWMVSHATGTAHIPWMFWLWISLACKAQKRIFAYPSLVWSSISWWNTVLWMRCWKFFAGLWNAFFLGIMPSQRHDGLPWGTDDPPQRKKWSGKPLQLQAMLTQFRGACFVLKFFFQFSGACLLVPKPFCRRLEDAQGRFSFASAQWTGWLLLALPSYSQHHEGL